MPARTYACMHVYRHLCHRYVHLNNSKYILVEDRKFRLFVCPCICLHVHVHSEKRELHNIYIYIYIYIYGVQSAECTIIRQHVMRECSGTVCVCVCMYVCMYILCMHTQASSAFPQHVMRECSGNLCV